MTTNTVAAPGTLYIVATPIGHLGDMVPRAIEVLQAVDLIAAEDTRHSARLMQHFGIQTPMQSYHDHNERDRVAGLLDRLKDGQSVALISDAGTPLISDPGYRLVHQARQNGHSVVPIPGPCAMIAALCASGLPSDCFVFSGFPPAKTIPRTAWLELQARETATLIFYESGHRLLASLGDMVKAFGADRQAVIARELTKHYETFLASPLAELVQTVSKDSNQSRGEIVVLVAGYRPPQDVEAAPSPDAQRLLTLLQAEGLGVKQAARVAAEFTGEKKNRLYQWVVEQN